MEKNNLELIKKLREETEMSLGEIKKALEEAEWDLEKAKEILRQRGGEFAEKKSQREAKEGRIGVYLHSNSKIGAIVEVRCETDFVAKSSDFQDLVHEILLQIVGAGPSNVEELLQQPYVRDPQVKFEEIVKKYIFKLGENIKIERFERYSLVD